MSSLVDFYRSAAEQRPDAVAFCSGPPAFGHRLTWSEIWRMANGFAAHLRRSGIRPGDRLGIIANSSWRWEVAQLGGFICHAVVVGIDSQESEPNLAQIAIKARIRVICFDQLHWLEKWKKATGFAGEEVDMKGIADWGAAPGLSEAPISPPGAAEAVIVFTSGTTSEPKGIVYTHEKLVYAVENILRVYPQESGTGRTVCWLPLANLFQRMMNFCTVSSQGTVYFIENPVEVLSHLATVRPTVFAAVPRFYEKIHDGIRAGIRKRSAPLRYFLELGLWLARVRWQGRGRRHWTPRQSALLAPWEFLLFRKIRQVFGGEVRFLISGSAPLRKELAVLYHSLGLPVLEAYGVSEDTVPIAANTLCEFRLGSVGKPVVPDSVRISEDGEIWLRNPGLFTGYLGVETQDCFVEGYYRTGDLGYFDPDGFLHLQGRKAGMFKTTTGKKVQVGEIEAHFKKLSFVDQVVVVGESRKVPLVLLSLDLASFARMQEVPVADLWDSAAGGFATYYQATIENSVRVALENVELSVRPAGAVVLPRRFSLDRQEITPNLKLRVKSIERQFKTVLDRLYLTIDEEERFPVVFAVEEARAVSRAVPTSVLGRGRVVLRILWQLAREETLRWGGRRPRARVFGQILRDGLGSLKGPLQKVGQMLSYLAMELPPEFREELSELYREGSPVAPNLIRTLVEEELRKPIPAVFCEWRDEPVSSASIGQVHWARLTTGEEVAVKVLNPGVEKMLLSDLEVLRWILPLLRRALNFQSIFPHFQELRELLVAECDLLGEAENLEIFGRIFAGDRDLIVPRVHRSLCTRRMLVMEYIHGQSFEEFRATADEEARRQAARVIWSISSRSINLYGWFNADPHPGNFLFTRGKVAVVDFGFCKHWEGDFIRLWKRQVLAGMGDDLQAFEEASRAVGVISTSGTDYYRTLLDAYHRIIFLPWLRDEPFHFSHDFVKEYLRELLQSQITVRGLSLPKEFLSLSRLYWGNFVLMAELDANENFYRLTIPYVKEELRDVPPISWPASF